MPSKGTSRVKFFGGVSMAPHDLPSLVHETQS